jgi:hypothetical protein
MKVKRRVSLVCSAIVVVWTAQPVCAQGVGTDLTLLLKDGMKIRITNDQGEVKKGRVESVSKTAVNVQTQGVTSPFLFRDIATVQEDDGLGNGATKGFATGAIGGLILGMVDGPRVPERRKLVVGVTVGGAIAGILYGVAIDALVHKVIYRRARQTVRAAPILKQNTVGASVILAWDRGQ